MRQRLGKLRMKPHAANVHNRPLRIARGGAAGLKACRSVLLLTLEAGMWQKECMCVCVCVMEGTGLLLLSLNSALTSS